MQLYIAGLAGGSAIKAITMSFWSPFSDVSNVPSAMDLQHAPKTSETVNLWCVRDLYMYMYMFMHMHI